ncbi:MAG: right-handed parallel beta-helix repeat-containing protein [Chitinispirillaceae bacterium]|nr:right-handed parallel beta-helix repeat-containing protein [Chitinispirillaceae bacterium]
MFDRENSDIVWVSPEYAEDEYGTWEQPYSSIDAALEHLEPGKTLVLKEGIYDGDLTIQVSGTVRKPIRITADDDALVQIIGGCWFLYDTSDLIISRLTFKNAPYGALSVIGKCNRNRFEYLTFVECGSAGKASCTMFFGGSGGNDNIVESCTFETSDAILEKSAGESVAMMISEGDLDDGDPVKNHILRKNTIKKYGYGILVGSSNSTVSQYGHIVEYNDFDDCLNDGLLVKCGDTLVRGNLLRNCRNHSIRVMAGCSTVIDSNRIDRCGNGIRVNGSGHTVINNCIIGTGSEAVTVCGSGKEQLAAASNLFVENNTFVNCGNSSGETQTRNCGIRVEPGTSCIIRKNLVYGSGKPLVIAESQISEQFDDEIAVATVPPQIVSDKNAVSQRDVTERGFSYVPIKFAGDCVSFENTTEYGAQGWVLTPQVFDPKIDETDEEFDYIDGLIIEDDDGELVIADDQDSSDLFSHLYGQESEIAFHERDDV